MSDYHKTLEELYGDFIDKGGPTRKPDFYAGAMCAANAIAEGLLEGESTESTTAYIFRLAHEAGTFASKIIEAEDDS